MAFDFCCRFFIPHCYPLFGTALIKGSTKYFSNFKLIKSTIFVYFSKKERKMEHLFSKYFIILYYLNFFFHIRRENPLFCLKVLRYDVK